MVINPRWLLDVPDDIIFSVFCVIKGPIRGVTPV